LKLLKLHSYERARGAAFRDDVYHANACVLLHEEPCYRVEYSPTGELSLQLMEGGPDKSEVSLGAMDTTFAEYLSIFLQTQTGASDKSGVFLSRNLQGAAHAEQEAALADVCVYNGLECKISCNTSKVSYVLDTEDLFHRRRRGLKAKATRAAHEGGPTPKEQAAAARFHEFVEKHAGQAEVMVQ
jgi:paired amphipathic helix protein Sin3a